MTDKFENLNIEVELYLDNRFVLSSDDTNKFLDSILSLGHGVINKNSRGEVTTSKNLALVSLNNNLIQVGLRSSLDNERISVIELLNNYCLDYDYEFKLVGYQPGFYTLENVPLVERMKEAYYKINNKYPVFKSLHIAVEVGLIKEKIKDLEVVIISPEIIGAHTPLERVRISSVELCDKWVFEFLNNFK